ncbi:MAG: hypothetical protein NUV63_09700 [Gallionella sp.]|nr:hypothetical protein [Gallionella sp.]
MCKKLIITAPMKSQPTALEMYVVAIVSLCTLFRGSREWGLAATLAQRHLCFSPFAVIGAYAACAHNVMLLVFVGAAITATMVVTVANDKLGTYLAEKFQACLRELESSARQAVQLLFNLPAVERIRLSKIDFTSAILPITPPPPRTRLAG